MTKIQKGENDVVFFWHGRGFLTKSDVFLPIVSFVKLFITLILDLEETTKCYL